MILLEDTRNQISKHKAKNEYFKSMGIEVERTKLYVGDYTLPTNQSVCVDTKKDIQELIYDICGKHHETFRNECIRANNANIKLYVLVENKHEVVNAKLNVVNKPIHDLKDLHSWVNKRLWIRKNGKRLYPNATKGITLQKACYSMQTKYGVEFLFCEPHESGKKILELLGVNKELKNTPI